jgi:CHASE2 domain-containing sensor protein
MGWANASLFAGWREKRGLRFAFAWHVVSTAIALLIAVALVVLEPFNLDQGLAERGRDLFYKVAAFAYPVEKSPKSIVITVDDTFLLSRDESWPMTYRMHAYILDEIASRKPKAIFIDLPFVSERPDETFGELIGTLRGIAQTTPVYIAAAPSVEAIRPATPSIIELVATEPNIHLVDITAGKSLGVGDAYPIAARGDLAPAAVRLYRDLYPSYPPVEQRSPGDEIDPWWATPKDPFNCRGAVIERDCAYLGQGVVRRLLFLMISGFLPEPPGVEDTTLVRVPYTPSIRAADLFKGDVFPQVTERTQGAVVFYGADVLLTGDRQESPIQGSVPGVYAHAMVFDNLVAFRGRYISAAPPFGLGSKGHTVLLLFMMAVLVVIGRLLATLWRPNLLLQPHLRGALFTVLDGAVLVVAGLSVALFEFGVMHIGPLAWATVFAAAMTGNLLASRPLASRAMVLVLRREQTARRSKRRKPRWRR